MSNKNIGLIAFVLAFGILAYFIYAYQQSQKQIYWSETYKENSEKKQYRPYDLTLLRDCLNGGDFQTKEVKDKLKNVLKDDLKNTNYIFIGEGLRADSSDYQAMATYISNGNDVFISSKYVAKKLLKHFLKAEVLAEKEEQSIDYEEETTTTEDGRDTIILPDEIITDDAKTPTFELGTFEDSLVNIALLNPENYNFSTGYYHYFNNIKSSVNWLYLKDSAYLSDNFNFKVIKIGEINKKTNCICINYGAGNLFLHTSPVLFTNIELLQKPSKDYATKLFSLLKKGDIYWDSNNRTSVSQAEYMDNSDEAQGMEKMSKREKTPLQYILSNPPLAWAWYSLLAMAAIFLIFTSKRRQRIVPVLARNTNTSLAFVQTIGRMYFNKEDHTALSRLQFKQWQWFVRERYALNTNKLDGDFEQKVVQKSGVKQNDVHRLLEAGKYIDEFNIIESNLIEFHKELNLFYKSCK